MNLSVFYLTWMEFQSWPIYRWVNWLYPKMEEFLGPFKSRELLAQNAEKGSGKDLSPALSRNWSCLPHSSKPSSQNLLMGFTVFFPVLIIIREPHICIPNGPFSKVCWHFSRFWIALKASPGVGRCPHISLYGSQHIDCLLYSLFVLIPGNLS